MENKKYTLEELQNLYVVKIIEMDRFSGPSLIEKKLFDSRREAELFCSSYNSRNTEVYAPDYYTVAEYVGKLN
jgi:hypothetical protein